MSKTMHREAETADSTQAQGSKKREKELQRKKLRKNYLEFLATTTDAKSELIEPGNEKLLQMFKRGNKLFEDVEHAREGTLDAQWLTQASEIGLQQCKNIHVGKEISSDDFINQLKTRYLPANTALDDMDQVETTFDWNKMGKDVSSFFKRTPSTTFMNGPLKVEIKTKIVKPRRQKQENTATVVQPEAVEKQEKSLDETMKKVSRVSGRLKKKSTENANAGAPFLDVVIDKNSFTHSIENIFYYAFLIKDGRASLQEKKGEMVANAANPGQNTEKKQCVLKLNLDIWKELAKRTNDGAALSSQKPAEKRKAPEEDEEIESQEVSSQPPTKRRR